MQIEPQVRPLPRRTRRITFGLFFVIFIASLPFLYLYATGYRFDFGGKTNFIGTGGMYIAAERTGAEIYIDGELVKETRVFRRAFYAQNLAPGTHRVHVQKEDHHTWVKELPVSSHLVTEAQAFNLPLVPQVRVVSMWQSATGSPIVTGSLLTHASTSNEVIATTTKATSTYFRSAEYSSLLTLFGTTSTSSTQTARQQALERVEKIFSATTTATSTEAAPTTTKEWRNVQLYENGDDVYARWTGSRESIPYYYCSPEFPPYSTSTELDLIPKEDAVALVEEALEEPITETEALIHPLQTVPPDAPCDPTIKMDRKWQTVHSFDFYPGSIDLVILSLDDGVYVAEVDDRSWQNVQPLILGNNLTMRVSNGQIYVYDGTLIYQIILEEY